MEEAEKKVEKVVEKVAALARIEKVRVESEADVKKAEDELPKKLHIKVKDVLASVPSTVGKASEKVWEKVTEKFKKKKLYNQTSAIVPKVSREPKVRGEGKEDRYSGLAK